MKYLHPIASVPLVLLLIAPASAKTLAPATPQAAIRAAYANMDRATDQRDAAGARAYCAPDFVQYDEDGHYNLAYVLGVMKEMLAHASSANSKSTIDRITLRGGTAVVIVHLHIVVTYLQPSQRKLLHEVGDETDRDYWIKRAGVWKLFHSQTLVQHSTENKTPSLAPSR